jgi:hypothetical protein
MHRKYLNVPFILIEQANNEGWLRSLAYYVRLKSVFRKSTYYRFSLRKVSQLIHCSPACLLHHLRVLEKEGLIWYHAGNLTCIGKRALAKKVECKRTVLVPINHKTQFDLLRSVVLKINLTRQAFRSRENAVKFVAPSFLPRYAKNNSLKDYVGLSCKSLGRLLSRSKATGCRVRKKLEKIGVIRSERVNAILFDGVSFAHFLHLKEERLIPTYAFYKNRVIYQPLHNRIETVALLKKRQR